MTLQDAYATAVFACPRCHAAIGEHCRSPKGRGLVPKGAAHCERYWQATGEERWFLGDDFELDDVKRFQEHHERYGNPAAHIPA